MKVKTMMKSKFFCILLIALFTVGTTGCYESSSEETAPSTDPGDNNGGGGETTPLGVDDTLSVPQDYPGGSLNVLRNDTNGAVITTFDTTSAQNGTVTRDGNTGNFTYVPPATYSGLDSFTYTVTGNGRSEKVTVKVTVDTVDVDGNAAIIDSGRDYFNKECGICHAAGSEDPQTAFNASDLVLSTNNLDYDMSLSDQVWNPPLMLYYSNLSQKELDGLRAYIWRLKNPL